ncbi:MAG: SAM-dependent methyltransferase, partial [Halioglobus sp.]|nr:SAM-dependent methyltransferase [Halioglobus sp.]
GGASRQVSSNQSHLHPRLGRTVTRHLGSTYRAAIGDHNRAAYAQLRERLDACGRPLVLDSFCGTGHSTRALSARHGDCLLVGIDKSAARLAKHPAQPTDGYLLLRADCEAIWQQLAADGIALAHHYILYPNPWPKSRHLQRRVHGHPAFRTLLALGGRLELRSNWQVYVEEFGVAMSLAGQVGVVSELCAPVQPLTLFERKYHDSGHPLWVYRCAIAP